jgi:hypothetical protein
MLSEADLPVRNVSAALPNYEVIPARSKNEAVLIRKMAVESEQGYRSEVERVAKTLVPLLIAGSYLSCVYDDSAGHTLFPMEMRKTGGAPNFTETDPGR